MDSPAVGDEVSLREPTETSWGFYGHDYPIGAGCFNWFKSWEELLEFIGEHEVNLGVYSGGDDDPDLEPSRVEVRKIVADLSAGRLSVAEGLTQLNSVLDGSGSQIRWWGKFSELLEGSGEFVEEVREEFRETGASDPINRAELESFVDFLKSYGA